MAAMAEPVQEAPPAPAPLAEHESIQDFTYAHLEPGEEEAPPPEAVEPPAPVVPARLKELRNDKGELNEDLIEQLATSAKATQDDLTAYQQAYETDPEWRLSFIKWRQRTGQTLRKDQLDELNAANAIANAPKAPPKPTREQVIAQMTVKFREIEAAQGSAEANAFWSDAWDKYVSKPEMDARFKSLEDQQAAIKKTAEEQTQEAIRRSAAARYSTELDEAARAYPTLLRKVGEQYTLPDADIKRVYDLLTPQGKSIKETLTMALRALGRDQKPAAPKPAVAVSRPNVTAAARTTAVRKPTADNIVIQPFSIDGE